jgi:hypothetical protein
MDTHYRIRLKGHLDPTWSAWFDGLAITHEASGETTLAGPVRDQAALYGLLEKARSLNLALVSVGEMPTAILDDGRADYVEDNMKPPPTS